MTCMLLSHVRVRTVKHRRRQALTGIRCTGCCRQLLHGLRNGATLTVQGSITATTISNVKMNTVGGRIPTRLAMRVLNVMDCSYDDHRVVLVETAVAGALQRALPQLRLLGAHQPIAEHVCRHALSASLAAPQGPAGLLAM